MVNWNDSFNNFVSENKLTKEQYFSKAICHVDELKIILKSINESLNILNKEIINEENFLSSTKTIRIRINEINNEISNLLFAPSECQKINEKLSNIITLLNNVSEFYGFFIKK